MEFSAFFSVPTVISQGCRIHSEEQWQMLGLRSGKDKGVKSYHRKGGDSIFLYLLSPALQPARLFFHMNPTTPRMISQWGAQNPHIPPSGSMPIFFECRWTLLASCDQNTIQKEECSPITASEFISTDTQSSARLHPRAREAFLCSVAPGMMPAQPSPELPHPLQPRVRQGK